MAILTFFFFNYTATTEIYTLSLHDALPISSATYSYKATTSSIRLRMSVRSRRSCITPASASATSSRSEEHTSELQSPCNLVCRLLLEKKNTPHDIHTSHTLSPVQSDLHMCV